MNSLSRIPPSLAEPASLRKPALLLARYEFLLRAEKAKELKPDLILLDLSMHRMDGAGAASILKDQMPEVRIILFAMYSEWFGDTGFRSRC